MTWESLISGVLQGISNFIITFVSIIGGSINPQATEGLISIFAIAIFYRICQGGVKFPREKISQLKRKDDDDEEYEYVMIKRKK